MAEKRFNRDNALTVVSAAILVGTQIIAAALALGWALGGLLGLGHEVTYALIALSLGAGIWMTWRFVANAARAEPLYD